MPKSPTEAQAAQAQKMQAIGQLAGGIAHDFSNLLTAMMGSCDLLLESDALSKQDRDEVTEIRRNGERAAALAQQLLAFSKQQSLQPQEVSLIDVLADVTKLLHHLLGEKISLRIEHQPDLWNVRVDINQFEQVIVNLAVNARDAMPEGGEVVISTGNVHAKDTDGVPAGDYVLCAVSDNGCGIAEENLERIFEPFFSTKERGRGVGLGLATVLGIIQQSGGYLLPESVAGKGSVFRVYLPRLRSSAKTNTAAAPDLPEASATNAATAKETRSILVVEDEESVRRFAVRALERRGFRVLQASSGEEALDLLERNDTKKLALLVSDVIMPGMDGPQLARQAHRLHPEMRVLFMSGYGSRQFREALDCGAVVDFLAKPFSLKRLVARVEEVLANG